MSTVTTTEPRPAGGALFALGFRPFFLGAGIYAVLTIALWAGVWSGALAIDTGPLAPLHWHAHEMIYGYALAVVAGFLLTAVRNWTGLHTARGAVLMLLAGLWAGARLAFSAGGAFFAVAAVLDVAFALLLAALVARPLVRAGQRRQAGVMAKLVLLGAGNVVFYLGLFGWLAEGLRWSIYGGLYVLVSLVLTIGGRVLPGFIERGVDYPVQLANPRWPTIASLSLFLVFFISDLFTGSTLVSAAAALGLFAVTAWRLVLWHTPGIWRKPLLWGLYLAFASIAAGFLMLALAPVAGLPRTLALHALGAGGIGLATLAMMARVALGHTGRDIRRPSPLVGVALGLLLLAVLARAFLPLLWPGAYAWLVGGSQALWVASFTLFLLACAPVLCRPRIDGRPG